MNDVANEMQDSLSRSGKGGLTAPLGVVDFSGAVPGVNFTAEPTSGLKRQTTEDVRIQVTTTDVLQCTKTGVNILSGGSLKTPVVEETGLRVMRGVSAQTVCFFYNDTPPTGWTLNEPDANIRELIIGPSGAGQGGAIGGSSDPTTLDSSVTTTVTVNLPANTGAHALTIAEMPAHTHDYEKGNPIGALDTQNGALFGTTTTPTSSTGSGAAHSHTIGGTAAGSGSGAITTITPRYARGILATLD